MVFYLHFHIGTRYDDNCYPYIAIAGESNSHIHIGSGHIKLIAEENSFYNPKDYFLTSRTIYLDLVFIDSLIHELIRQDDYELITWLERKKSLTISYYRWPGGRFTQRHIFENYRDEVTDNLVNTLYPIMEQLMGQVFQID